MYEYSDYDLIEPIGNASSSSSGEEEVGSSTVRISKPYRVSFPSSLPLPLPLPPPPHYFQWCQEPTTLHPAIARPAFSRREMRRLKKILGTHKDLPLSGQPSTSTVTSSEQHRSSRSADKGTQTTVSTSPMEDWVPRGPPVTPTVSPDGKYLLNAFYHRCCFRCGDRGHLSNSCRSENQKLFCSGCGKLNVLSKNCCWNGRTPKHR